MSWIFTRAQGIDKFVSLRPTMDDASWFAPFIETCAKDRLPWSGRFAIGPKVHAFACRKAAAYLQKRGRYESFPVLRVIILLQIGQKRYFIT